MAVSDLFATLKPWNWLRPYHSVVAVDAAKSDTVDVNAYAGVAGTAAETEEPRGFSISVAGTVKLTLWDGTIISFVINALTPGVIYPLRVKRVWSTGTAATGMHLWF